MTSIEYLYEKLRKSDRRMHEFLLEQAKEMYKQEIIKAYDDANGDEYFDNGTPIKGEDYYNEKFKKDYMNDNDGAFWSGLVGLIAIIVIILMYIFI